MSRRIAALALAAASLAAQQPQVAQPDKDRPQLKRRDEATPKLQEVDKDGLPPEEDKSLATPVYGFNPLQAQKEINVGNQYFKKGTPSGYRAAAGRYEEATKWNSEEPEAWLKLGEAQEKLHDAKAAKAAYSKYLELAGNSSKTADEIRKKIEKMK